jgi:hypothetical protein
MRRKMIVLLMVMSAFCGTANAQLSDILGKVAGTASGNSTLSSLTGIISSKLIPTEKQIIGTWAYQEPAVMFTSDNALKSAAGSVASASVEKKLQTYFSKVGIKKGNLTMTFDENKVFAIKKDTKSVRTGTYAIEGSTVTLTFKGKTKPCKITPQLDNGSLVMVMDATSLKNFMSGIASYVSSLSTVTTVLNAYDGMKVGIRLSKQ